MTYTPITLEQQAQINRIRLGYGSKTAAWHAFHSLFLWQETLKLSLLLEDDFFAVRYGAKGENAYFMPCGAPEKVLQFLRRLSESGKFRLFNVCAEDKAFLEQAAPGAFRFRYDRDSSEYLYDIQKNTDLSGKQNRYIRRDIRSLTEAHQLETEPLTQQNIQTARQIVADWFHADIRGEIIRQAELNIAEKLFQNMDALSVQGFLLYLDGIPAAVAAGIPLSDTVFDFTLLKQASGEKGLGTFMYYTLMQKLSGAYQYLNAEEDMGIAGLRQKKTEMHPCGMVDIWEAVYEKA